MHDLDPVFERFSRTPRSATVADDLGFDDPRSVVGFWFAIEDATIENGCLWAVPGGHRGPVRSRFRYRGIGTVTETIDPTPGPTDDLVPREAKAGTLILLDGLLPHWSGASRSSVSRHAYTLQVIEGGADYPADDWLQRSIDPALRGFRD